MTGVESDVQTVDVAVVGGGVAGCATALMLRRHAPDLRVAMLEAGDYTTPQLGESMPPLALQLLKQLGLGPALSTLVAEGIARPSHGVEIVWGSSTAMHQDYLQRTRGDGLHLDRSRFNAWLARMCEQVGVELKRGVRVRDVDTARNDGRLRLRLQTSKRSDGGTFSAAMVIDAAGRTSPVATRLGVRSTTYDDLVAIARYFGPGTAPEDPRLTVASFPHGWWYAAGLPGDRLVIVALTDADLMRELELRERESWLHHLPPVLVARLGERRPNGSPIIRSAASRRLDRVSGVVDGAGWLAVGDAASTFDPLSSQGLCRALRGGIFAAYAAADFLSGNGRNDPDQRSRLSLERYSHVIQEEFRGFLGTRSEVYDTERRWPENRFWQRRAVTPSTTRIPEWPGKSATEMQSDTFQRSP